MLPAHPAHTGAKRFILNDGDVFTRQRMLGHTTMHMVRRYVQLSNLDVRDQHARFSPADSLLRKPTPDRGNRSRKPKGLRNEIRDEADSSHCGFCGVHLPDLVQLKPVQT